MAGATAQAEQATERTETLHWQMVAGFLIGLTLGLIAHVAAPGAVWVETLTTYVTGPFGQIFLRLLFMLVIPLLFSALVVGIAEMGEIRALKRIGVQTLVYTIIVSTIAVVISIALVNLIRPGDGIDPAVAAKMLAEGSAGAADIVKRSAETPTGMEALINIVPANIIEAMANNEILAVMFFALFFGVGILLVQSRNSERLKDGIEGLFEVSMRLIGIVIRLAPIAVACFMFNLAAIFGWELLGKLVGYVAVVLLALGVQMFVIFPLILKFVAGKSPIDFFRQTQEASVMAFSTASSNATLPTALCVADSKLRLPPRIARFVLTIGATANQNGTAMFEGVTVLFLAQFFNVDLTLTQQFVVMLICILGGIGTAGVPAGSLPVIALILGMMEVPPAGIGLVLGVDRLLDMCRTTLNVTGDLVCAQTISALNEGEAAARPAPNA